MLWYRRRMRAAADSLCWKWEGNLGTFSGLIATCGVVCIQKKQDWQLCHLFLGEMIPVYTLIERELKSIVLLLTSNHIEIGSANHIIITTLIPILYVSTQK